MQWDKLGTPKKINSTFIFSFNRKEKYLPRNEKYSIYSYESKGPRFGYSYPEIYLPSTFEKGRSYQDNSTNSTFLFGRKLTNGEEYWDVKELEVYKINYI